MTNTFIIRLTMDDASYIEREYADTTLDTARAEADRLVEHYAQYDWYCEEVQVGFITDEGEFQEIWGAYYEREKMSEDFPDLLAESDDFGYDEYNEPDFDLECGFDPYEGCYTWDC